MRTRFSAVGLVLVLLALPPPSTGQEGLITFNLDTLLFSFYPAGLGTAAGPGSAMQVFADNILFEGLDAEDIRRCIDNTECPYPTLEAFSPGDSDGRVETPEVIAFQNLTALALPALEDFQPISALLVNNMSVDGFRGRSLAVKSVLFTGAEGAVDSRDSFVLDATMEIGYDNDRGADHHEIVFKRVHLLNEGFTTDLVQVRVVSTKAWHFVPGDTLPASFQDRVTPEGWTSNQADFETASDQDLKIVAEEAGGGGLAGGAAIWIWILVGAAVIGAGILGYVFWKRKQE